MGMLKMAAGHLQLRTGGTAFPVLAHTHVTSGAWPGSLARAVSTREICSVPARCLQHALLLPGSSTAQA